MFLISWLRVHCGVTEPEFWRLTPAKVSSLITVKKEAIKRDDYRAGIITTTIRAALGARNAQVFDDFPEHKTTVPNQNKSNLGSYLKNVAAMQKKKPSKP